MPIITHPTRIASRTATLLDFISISNPTPDYTAGIITSPISDHFPVFYIETFKIDPPTPKSISFRDFSGIPRNLCGIPRTQAKIAQAKIAPPCDT